LPTTEKRTKRKIHLRKKEVDHKQRLVNRNPLDKSEKEAKEVNRNQRKSLPWNVPRARSKKKKMVTLGGARVLLL